MSRTIPASNSNNNDIIVITTSHAYMYVRAWILKATFQNIERKLVWPRRAVEKRKWKQRLTSTNKINFHRGVVKTEIGNETDRRHPRKDKLPQTLKMNVTFISTPNTHTFTVAMETAASKHHTYMYVVSTLRVCKRYCIHPQASNSSCYAQYQ